MADAFYALLGFGFLLGVKHALDADHVVAVSAIAAQTKGLRSSSLVGAVWGLGHATTLLFVGLLILGFKLTIPESLALSLEFLVGVMLVLLGADVLRGLRGHRHEHRHRDAAHVHLHTHRMRVHNHAHRSFVVGMVHGLAGSAALTLIVLAAASSLAEGVLYLLVFGVGSAAGMTLLSVLMSVPFNVSFTISGLQNRIQSLAGVLSVVLGTIIMYEIGFVEGLFL